MIELLKAKFLTSSLACLKVLTMGYVTLADVDIDPKSKNLATTAIFKMNIDQPMPALIGQVLTLDTTNVFVDSLSNPKSSLVKMLSFHWLSGIPNEALIRKAVDIASHTDTILYTPAWRSALIKYLSDQDINFEIGKRSAVSHGTLDPNHLRNILERLPPEYRIVKIDRPFAEKLFGSNYFQSGWHVTTFKSVDNFLENGFGYILLKGEAMVAAASTAAVFDDEIEIQIDTHIDFRRQGLAKFISAKLVLEALDRGFTPHWDAVSEPSRKIALELGYSPSDDYEVIYIGHAPR